ncbi:MAG: dockerin type I repeat-containing protein [Armatimonadota bacterium]
MPRPGSSVVVTATVANDGDKPVDVITIGLAFHTGEKDVTSMIGVTPLEPYPARVEARGVRRFGFLAVASPQLSVAPIAASARVFAFDASVGGGVNLLTNPGLEGGTGSGTDPPGWQFGQDYPSEAQHGLTQSVFLGGQWAYYIAKTAGLGQSYLQQIVPRNRLKPRTAYTVSAWVRTEGVPAGGAAMLVVWWDDGAYHQAPYSQLVAGTTGWTRLTVGFATGDRQPNMAIVRLQVAGAPGGTVWFDNVTMNEGTADGGMTVQSPYYWLGAVPGDVDGDGRVTSRDVSLVLKAALGLTQLSASQLAAVDLNGNARADLGDVVACLRLALGLPAAK